MGGFPMLLAAHCVMLVQKRSLPPRVFPQGLPEPPLGHCFSFLSTCFYWLSENVLSSANGSGSSRPRAFSRPIRPATEGGN